MHCWNLLIVFNPYPKLGFALFDHEDLLGIIDCAQCTQKVDGKILIAECTQMCAFQSDTPCPNQDATLIAGDDDDDEDAKGFTKICLCINIIIGINNETSNISINQ